MKYLTLCSLFLFAAQLAPAQDSLKRVRSIRINDVCAQLSAASEFSMLTDADDFRNMFPGSAILKNDLSGYTQETRATSTINSGLTFFAGANFKFADKSKTAYRKNIRLRAGLSVSSFQLNSSYQQISTKPFGSVSSTVFIDSVTRRNYYMNYSGTQLRADVSFLWSSDQEKHRLAVYTGLGISGGVSVNTNGSVAYSVYNDIQVRDAEPDYSYYANQKTTTTYENFKGVSNYGFSGYVPLGADLRLGKTRAFWTRTHLYYELKPMYNVLVVRGANAFSNFGIHHGWGLRFTV